MPKLIVLNNVVKQDNIIGYELSIDGNNFTLSYRFAFDGAIDFNKIEPRFDPIVVTLLYHALTHGFDFQSKYPISNELLYQLTYQLIPQILRCAPEGKLHPVEIDAPLEDIAEVENWIGIGMNCDIESEAAYYDYSRISEVPDSLVTHLIYFKTGAQNQATIDSVKHFRERARRRLIVIDSNLADVLKDAFGDSDYQLSHTFRNCGAVTILQNYFRRFYYPTAINIDEFNVDVDRDCSYYDRWFLQFISSRRLKFFLADCRAATRFEKLKLLSTYNYSYDTLHVCKQSDKNCGHCDDCLWTLKTLEELDVLKRYKYVFDVDEFQRRLDQSKAQ